MSGTSARPPLGPDPGAGVSGAVLVASRGLVGAAQLREVEEQCCDAWVVWALPGAGRPMRRR